MEENIFGFLEDDHVKETPKVVEKKSVTLEKKLQDENVSFINERENTLWVEKYRPKSLSEYVGNEEIKAKFQEYINKQDIPHLLLHDSTPGTGKTTAAKMIANLIQGDVKYVNASDKSGVDFIRQEIEPYCQNISFTGGLKIIILDEQDFMSQTAQASLRNMMETYSKNVRFILTCNYLEKVIDPIKSRCQKFTIIPPTKIEVEKRVEFILKEEKVNYSLEDVKKIIDNNFPDIRSIIGECQKQVNEDNQLIFSKASNEIKDYQDQILLQLQKKDRGKAWLDIRQILVDSKIKHFENLFKFLYNNLDGYAKGHLANITIIIAKYQYEISFVVDKEISVMGMFSEIINELNS